MNFVQHLRAIYSLSAVQLGIDPVRFFKGIKQLPYYFRTRSAFKKLYRGPMEWRVFVHDRTDDAGSLGEYFWQDLYVARMIARLNPSRHVDIGSRIDGFIGHLACFREVEVIDIRPLESRIPGVTFLQGDMTGNELTIAASPSVSCLHTVEHFGLGRYSDPIDPDGMRKGLVNLASLVAPGGTLYVSTPVGKPRVVFNAHRISHPDAVMSPLLGQGLELKSFSWFADDKMHESLDAQADMAAVGTMQQALGIFILTRPPD